MNAGGPCLIDELYLFLTVEDAIAFYEHGVDDPEFVSEDGLACGFDKISLRVCGQEIAVRSKPVRNMCEGEHA